MRFRARFSSLLRSLFRQRALDRELEEELHSYLETLTEEKIAAGLSRPAARRAALLEMEGVEQVKEKVREVRMGTLLQDLGQDTRYGLRMLRKNPGFTAVVVLTLALGIGCTTAIFSFVHGILLRPLPYPVGDRLVVICETHPERQPNLCLSSPANQMDWAAQSETIEAMGLARNWPMSLKQGEELDTLDGGLVTPGLFEVFGIQPAHGRFFRPEDNGPGNDRKIVVSHAFWESRLGGSPDVTGQTLVLDGEPHEVVGVLPADFAVQDLEFVQFWAPLGSERQGSRDWRGFTTFGRLAQGAKLEAAQAEISAIRNRLAEQYPKDNESWDIRVRTLQDHVVGNVRPSLLLLLGAVGLVLLIGCANVANLFLARVAQRERELAVRVALGARPLRLIRQLLTEGLLLSLLGGLAGIFLAMRAVDLFGALAPGGIPRLDQVKIDAAILLFTFLLSLLTSVLFGLAPALQALNPNVSSSLRHGPRSSGSRAHTSLRNGLIVAEVGLSLILLIGAGLLLGSFANQWNWQPGFERENLVAFPIFGPFTTSSEDQQVVTYWERVTDELRSIPGLLSVGAGSSIPLLWNDGREEFRIAGRPAPPAGERPSAAWHTVGPDYFRTLGVPLQQGRFFAQQDTQNAPKVAIINQTFARKHFPEGNPLGQRVVMSADNLARGEVTVEIVGVVGDVQPFGSGEAPAEAIYQAYTQHPRLALVFMARTATSPSDVVAVIRARLEKFDSNLTLNSFLTMNDLVKWQLIRPRFTLSLMGLFAILSLLMAAIGVYGVISYSVAQRAHEFGIRMALGAKRGDILRMVVWQGMTLTFLGVGLGVAGAFALARFLESLLVGVTATDPATLAVVSVVLVTAALFACYVPARRATKVDPIVALRCE